MILAFNQINSSAVSVVFVKETIISSHQWDPQETRDLLVNLTKVIEKAKIKLSDLEGIFMINGPGNFTPVRISCVVANAFANELDIPIYEISSKEFEKYYKIFVDLNDVEILVKIFNTKKLTQKNFVESIFNKEPKMGA